MKNLKTILMSFLLLLMISCANDAEKTAEEVITEGWTAVEGGTLNEALSSFNNAISLDNNAIEAHVGKAFTLALLGQVNTALTAADVGLAIKSTNTSLLAAKGFLLSARASTSNSNADYEASNTNLNSAFFQNNAWTIAHGINLTFNDIHVTMAQNYFSLKDYTNALTTIKKRDNTFNADVNSESGINALSDKIFSYNKALSFN